MNQSPAPPPTVELNPETKTIRIPGGTRNGSFRLQKKGLRLRESILAAPTREELERLIGLSRAAKIGAAPKTVRRWQAAITQARARLAKGTA